MSDTKWLLQHGFKEIENFQMIFIVGNEFYENSNPYFNDCVKSGECPDKLGNSGFILIAPIYTDYYKWRLRVLAQEINILLKVIKLETREQAQKLYTSYYIFFFTMGSL